jgi:hypothetical protein
MSVSLEAIKFNHNTGSATADALNIRRNATQTVTVPEWRQGVSVNPEDSPAAYSIADTTGHTITIQANFRRLDPALGSVEIRAVDPVVDPPGPGGCMGWLWTLIQALVRAIAGNVLGDVKARQVSFGAGGETGFQTFELQNLRLWTVGVGVRTTTWTWQYRVAGGPWTDIATTTHRIYSVLHVPTAPWQQAPYNAGANTQLPWTEVLDHACQWAVLATDRDAAAGRVTQRVNGLGPSIITYDCPTGGSTKYAIGAFNLTAFLERLTGGPGLGEFVNCTDCATITSTFANAIGCDLWQSRMYGAMSFGLNPMLGIGSGIWEPCCLSHPSGIWSGSFSYHEVAWKGACGVDDEVFDACLKVDGDPNPTAAPHTALLPVNMRFGNPGDGDYRDRLATPAGRPNCNPQPASRVRRSVA